MDWLAGRLAGNSGTLQRGNGGLVSEKNEFEPGLWSVDDRLAGETTGKNKGLVGK